MAKPNQNESLSEVHVDPPVDNSKEEKRPAGAGPNGDSRETGGNPSKTVKDPGMGSERTGA